METAEKTIMFSDICFKDEYFKLFEGKDIAAETFYYNDKDKKFSMSYLKRAIPDSDYFDFETAYGYSGPVSNTNEAEFLRNAWHNFHQYCKDNRIIGGFIRFNPVFDNHIFVDPDFVDVVKEKDVVLMSLKCKTEDEIWSRYSQNNRNKIRLAVKNSVIIRMSDDTRVLLSFRDMYTKTMDRVGAHSFYYFKEDFFEKIAKYLRNSYTVLTAYINDRPIAGALVFFTDTVLYYFLSATLEEGRKTGAANLLRHESIKFGKRQDVQFINFGGGNSSDKGDRLFRFKRGFSNELKSFYIGKLLVNREEYEKLCKKWLEISSREKIEKYKNRFLKYRE